jgi:hypothetical protein
VSIYGSEEYIYIIYVDKGLGEGMRIRDYDKGLG